MINRVCCTQRVGASRGGGGLQGLNAADCWARHLIAFSFPKFELRPHLYCCPGKSNTFFPGLYVTRNPREDFTRKTVIYLTKAEL